MAMGLIVVGEEGSRRCRSIYWLEGTATHLIFAHVCDSRARTTVAGQSSDYPNPAVTAPGEHLADYVIYLRRRQRGASPRSPQVRS